MRHIAIVFSALVLAYALAVFGAHDHAFEGHGTPTVSCGTGGAIAGLDGAFLLTVGTAATTCTVTFAGAFSTAPVCLVSDRGGLAALMTYTTTTSSMTLTLGIALVSTNKYDVVCYGPPYTE